MRGRPDVVAVEPDGESGGRGRPAAPATRRSAMPGCGQVGAGRAAAAAPASGRRSGRSPSRTSSRPSLGCARGADVPARRATGRSWPRPPGRATSRGGRRGGRRTSGAGRRQHRAEVDRAAAWRRRERSRASSPVPPSVRHRSPPSRPSGGSGSSARRAASTTARASASVRTTTPSVGQRARARPSGSPFSDRHRGRPRRRLRRPRAPRWPSTTPRCRASAACRARGRGGRHRRDVADLAQQVDELLDVADEVAARERPRPRARASRPSPAAQAWARATKPASGGRVGGRPARLLVGVELVGQRARGRANRSRDRRRREPRRGRRSAAAVLVGEARDAGRPATAASRSSNTPAWHRLGDQQVGTRGRSGPARSPRVGERPAVEVAPGLEQPQHPVEAAGQRLGAALAPGGAGRRARARPARPAPAPAGARRGRGSRRPGGASAAADGRVVGRRRRRRVGLVGGAAPVERGPARSASATWCWKARLFGVYGSGSSTVPDGRGRLGRSRRRRACAACCARRRRCRLRVRPCGRPR